MITLRPYQEESICALRDSFKEFRRLLYVAPTGSGKGIVIAFMIENAIKKGKRVILQCHRRILTTQLSNTLKKVGVEHGFIAAGYKYDPKPMCHIAIVNTLSRRMDKVARPDFLIIDEAHISGGQTEKILKWVEDAFVVGVTASPCKLSGKGLGDHYTKMVKGKSVAWLIENKFLSEYKYYAPASQINLKGIRTKNGDYDVHQIEAEVMKPKLVGDVVENYRKYADGKRTILFAPSIKASKEIVAAFNAAGIQAAHLDGETEDEIRTDAIKDFADGKILLLSNVAIMTEGFDLNNFCNSDVPIEAVILYTATKSLAKHLQCIGRALRPKPTPAIIIDHGSGYKRFGLPDDEQKWTLADRPKKEAAQRTISIRQCPKCYNVHFPAPVCDACGHIYEIKSRQIEKEAGELTEIKRNNKRDEWRCKTLEDFIALGKARGYEHPYGWAKHKMRVRNVRN